MQKQGPSTVDTRVPAIATTLSSLSHLGSRTKPHRNLDLDIRPHRNQIFLGGRRQGARRLLTPDLHRIESANSHWEVMSETYVDCRDVRDCLPSASLGNPPEAGKQWRDKDKVGVAARVWCEDLKTGTLSSGAYVITLYYDRSIQRVNSLDIQLRGR